MRLTSLLTGSILAGTLAISTAGIADEEKNISVFVKKHDDKEAVVDLKINGDASVFKLPTLSDGESRVVTTESGKSFTVSLNDGNYTVVTDSGEEINIPRYDNNELSAKVLSLHKNKLHANDDVITISGGNLSEDQMTAVKAAILSAGITKEVKFSKGLQVKFFSKDAFSDGTVLDIENALHLSTDEEHIVHEKDGKVIKKIIIKTDEETNN
ncbi:MAG: hypothetical protein HWE27_02735 [Gammaproteobacteria bacterium]|nr:hypothetical protein [Gammaproteobacteria bacterium]